VDITEFGKNYKMNYIIITSINQITKAVIDFSNQSNFHVIVVGDKKSIPYEYNNVTYLKIEDQNNLNYDSVKTTPYNHYSRKNIGYLYAIKNNADLIYDTDDDTFPYENWGIRNFICETVIDGSLNINPYKLFSDKKIWPRGLDIRHINKNENYRKININSKIGVWQGVIDGDSDFDAIYRLTIDKHIVFDKNEDVAINKECYAPFNTQSTLWNKDVYPLLYIPISVDFRFTDILRGYVAQKIMWNYGYKLGFHSANTYQIRNQHDYYKDFLGEISMYKSLPKLLKILKDCELQNKSIYDDLFCVYELLHKHNIVKFEELKNINNWIKDLKNIIRF